MMGSGTTLVEALAAGRRAVGFDIDPLAMLISSVKTRSIEQQKLSKRTRDCCEGEGAS